MPSVGAPAALGAIPNDTKDVSAWTRDGRPLDVATIPSVEWEVLKQADALDA